MFQEKNAEKLKEKENNNKQIKGGFLANFGNKVDNYKLQYEREERENEKLELKKEEEDREIHEKKMKADQR